MKYAFIMKVILDFVIKDTQPWISPCLVAKSTEFEATIDRGKNMALVV